MKKIIALMLSFSLLSSVAIAEEEAASVKEARNALKFRQSLFQLIRSNMGDLGAMAKGVKPFDAAVMEKNGMRLEQLSLMIADYLATDTREHKLETDALDKIWEEPDNFNEKIQALTTAAQRLQAVAKAGDESQFRSAIGGVGKSCKGCHDVFKAE
ncbi:c-type cytochrome [Planctobacterium marinum]|uniref:c-type cytochrome n=1 Tax=Planctobacterium marinum TaxID=1631968 RepID=UPI001E5FAA50|nr:cytochrome c [Planctobacterium marinum]MCC2607353.1 cytochrome c [Planctobacterium marinum]